MSKLKTNLSARIGQLASWLPLKSLIKLSNVNLILPFYHAVSDDKLSHIKHLYKPRTIKQFESDLDFLLKNFNPVSLDELLKRSQSQFINVEKPSFHLSFDDGLKQVKTIIAPILKIKGIPATVFCNTDFIDNKNLFYRFKESLLVDYLIGIKESDIDYVAVSKILQVDIVNKESLLESILNVNYFDSDKLDNLASFTGLSFTEYLKTNEVYLNTQDILELQKDGFAVGSNSIDNKNFRNLNY